jgi:hypothetical protein
MIYARTPVAGRVQSDSEIDPYSDFRLDASYVTDGFIVWCLKSWLGSGANPIRSGKSTQEITHYLPDGAVAFAIRTFCYSRDRIHVPCCLKDITV